MAPETSRWRDIVLAPCNASAARRNWAATRDALQALAEEPAAEVTQSTSSELKFFQVLTSNVGGDSVQVREVSFNTATSDWDLQGGTFTAWDWTPNGIFKQNFTQDFYGVGRVASTDVGQSNLEILAIEGYARFVEGRATTTMTGQTATVEVQEFWGDPLNGRSPGNAITVNDVTNQAPNLAINDKVLAVFDEKRAGYVLIAPWKGSQPPGTSALVQVKGGDTGLGCADSVEKNGICLYTGVKAVISAQALIDEAFCSSKFDEGQEVWIMDARNCRTVDRLQHLERYIAVSMLDEFDPDPGGSSDPRPLYAVVDASPPLRWFRVFTNAESIALGDGVPNELQCRDCDEDTVSDDAPSVWGKWQDRLPCDFATTTVPDPSPQLIYFPFHSLQCKTPEEQAAANYDECWDVDVDPYCRNNELVLAFWNPIAQRWEAITDVQKCIEGNGVEVAHVMICDGTSKAACCMYDGVKLTYSPRNDSYCSPRIEHEKVWVRCANGSTEVLNAGFCRLSVKICNQFPCGTGGERRPAFMFDCGDCDACSCPDPCQEVRFTISANNINSDCAALINGISGTMQCLDEHPVKSPPPIDSGFWGEFTVLGIQARKIYGVTGSYTPPSGPAIVDAQIWIEIACGGTGHPPGTILGAYDEDLLPISGSITYTEGIVSCQPLLDGDGNQLYSVRNYRYGIWGACTAGDTISFGDVDIHWLKDTEFVEGTDAQTVDPTCDDADCDRGPISVPTNDAVWASKGFINSAPCCANSQVFTVTGIMLNGCTQGSYFATKPVNVIGLESVSSGQKTCPGCNNGEHPFVGCPCEFFDGSSTGTVCNRTPSNGGQCLTIDWSIQIEWTLAAP